MSGTGRPHLAVVEKGGVRSLSFETSSSLSYIGVQHSSRTTIRSLLLLIHNLLQSGVHLKLRGYKALSLDVE
jgi:hypothetical protein